MDVHPTKNGITVIGIDPYPFNYDEPLQWHDILLLDKGFERLTNP